MTRQNGQMALDVSLRDKVSFDSFVTGHNAELKHHMIRVAEGKEVLAPLFIWGESGGGKSHLLNSCYRLAEENEQKPWFISLSDLSAEQSSEALLSDLNDHDIYLIDGLDNIAGMAEWEEKLFQLCNLARDKNKSIIISAIKPPTSLALGLRDLVTRLMSGLTYQVLPLGDEQKITALQERASDRGFEISEGAVKFILNRYRRETGNLFKILDQIDQASLEQKRLITIPFLRSLKLE
ncbi:MAG: DnaA regulatory inactivator Hda [Pseudomonadota bacterium]|nr:DnaA regulatory inactivator Hda [Pseudomonadota bacterium]